MDRSTCGIVQKMKFFMAEIMALLNSDPPCNTDSVLGLG